MKVKNLLVISNGRGEDSIAITILEQLKLVCQEENAFFDKAHVRAAHPVPYAARQPG